MRVCVHFSVFPLLSAFNGKCTNVLLRRALVVIMFLSIVRVITLLFALHGSTLHLTNPTRRFTHSITHNLTQNPTHKLNKSLSKNFAKTLSRNFTKTRRKTRRKTRSKTLSKNLTHNLTKTLNDSLTQNLTHHHHQRLTHTGPTNSTKKRSPHRHQGRGEKKMLIYVCMGNQSCAGWSDRQKSLVSMFLLANITNRRFGILLQTPCDVRNFYEPNKYNWTVDEKDLQGRSQKMIYPHKIPLNVDFNQQHPEDVLFARTNMDIFSRIKSEGRFKALLPSWAKTRKYGRYFHDAWDILMKPTPKPQRRLDQMLDQVHFHNRTRPLVGVHLRMGRNPSNPNERKVFSHLSLLGALWRRVDTYVNNGSQLFLATDSGQVRGFSRERYGKAHHDTAAFIMHVGKQRGEARAPAKASRTLYWTSWFSRIVIYSSDLAEGSV